MINKHHTVFIRKDSPAIVEFRRICKSTGSLCNGEYRTKLAEFLGAESVSLTSIDLKNREDYAIEYKVVWSTPQEATFNILRLGLIIVDDSVEINPWKRIAHR